MPIEGSRAPSKSRITAPLALSPLILPSTALAVLYAAGAKSWGAPGTLSSDFVQALMLGAPTLVWSGSWLVGWDDDPAFPEPRMIVCGVACALAFAIYLFFGLAWFLSGIGNGMD
jgi:hypothetical protein